MPVKQHIIFNKLSGVVPSSVLIEKYNVPKSTIQNGYNNSKLGNSKSWFAIKEGEVYWILYDTIPTNAKNKYKLESYEEIINQSQLDKELNSLKFNDQEKNIIHLELKISIESTGIWKKYIAELYDKITDHAVLQQKAIEYSLWNTALKLEAQGYELKKIHSVLEVYDDDIFRISNYNYFTTKIKLAKEEGILSVILHGSLGRTFESRTYFTAWHKKIVNLLYSSDKKLSVRQIHSELSEKAIKNGREEVSYSTVQKYLQDLENTNPLNQSRHGIHWARLNQHPYLQRLKPSDADDQWQADGTELQFYVKDRKTGKTYRPWIFIVVDIASLYIISYSIGKKENTELVFRALTAAIDKTHKLPAELLCDNSSAIKSNPIKNLVNEAAKWSSMEFRQHKVGNAKDKGAIERLFRTLQSHFRLHDRFIGDGITSKSLNNHMSKDKVAMAYQNAISEDNLENIVSQVIEVHNSSDYKSCSKTPHEIYRNSKSENSTRLNSELLIRLKNENMGRHKIRKAAIQLVRNKVKSVYQITDPAIGTKLELTSPLVLRPYFDDSLIYLFKSEEKGFICEATLKIFVSTTGSSKKTSMTHIQEASELQKAFEKFSKDYVNDLKNGN